jgi:hypothetical protein
VVVCPSLRRVTVSRTRLACGAGSFTVTCLPDFAVALLAWAPSLTVKRQLATFGHVSVSDTRDPVRSSFEGSVSFGSFFAAGLIAGAGDGAGD